MSEMNAQLDGPYHVLLVSVIVGAVVLALVVQTFMSAGAEIEQFSVWCDAHNGTMHAGGTLYCELPNGTEVGSQEVGL